MEIQYLGHSCFKVKSQNTKFILDPFDPKMVGIKLPLQEADFILVSHHHRDHDYVEAVRGYRKVIDAPGEYEIGGVSVFGFPTFHDSKEGEEKGKNTIYLIEAEGLKILHLGDLGHKLSEKQLEEVGEVNILMVPVGDKFSLGPKEAAEIIREIEPQITLPMHYRFDGINEEVFAGLLPVEDFLEEVGLAVERLPKLSIKLPDLEENQRIVLLERK